MGKPDFISGFVDGDGSSCNAARADHEHKTGLKAVKKTIKVADWNNKAAEVPFEEGTYVGYQVDAASVAAATTAVLVLSSVGTGKLTFGCTTTPAAALDVYVLYL